MIGRNNDLPWRLPNDLKRFKTITMGKPILMGRKTWESIGRPLPGRRNIVITRNPAYVAEGAEVARSLDAALALVADAGEAMIIGGAGLYKDALSKADRLYRTEVHAEIEGDTYFPSINSSDWSETMREDCPADERHAYPYSFVTLDRSHQHSGSS